MAQSMDDPPGERRLARTELSLEPDHAAGQSPLGQRGGDGLRDTQALTFVRKIKLQGFSHGLR